METGLYGQAERGQHFAERADENRFADVESEGVHKGITTEQQYRLMMADCIREEILAGRHEDTLWGWYDSLAHKDDLILNLVCEAIGATRDQQTRALERMAALEERMMADGFHIAVRQNAMTAALPLALNLMREERMRRHPNADKPRSRCGRSSEVYSAESIAKYGDSGENPALNDIFDRMAKKKSKRTK